MREQFNTKMKVLSSSWFYTTPKFFTAPCGRRSFKNVFAYQVREVLKNWNKCRTIHCSYFMTSPRVKGQLSLMMLLSSVHEFISPTSESVSVPVVLHESANDLQVLLLRPYCCRSPTPKLRRAALNTIAGPENITSISLT